MYQDLSKEALIELLEARDTSLVALREELKRCIFGVNHNLRKPLRAISGFSAYLKEGGVPEEQKDLVGRIVHNADLMEQMLDGFEFYGKLLQAKVSVKAWPLKQLLEEVWGSHTQALDNAHLFYELEASHQIWVDKELFKVCLEAFISNSIKFAKPEQGVRLHIGQESREGETVYFIRDEGVGFELIHPEYIFGLFQRMHLRKEYEGLGLGLTLAHLIVLRHGGNLWAESTEEQGAIFYFRLPEAQAHYVIPPVLRDHS